MAGFVENVSEPRDVTGSIPVHNSSAAAIGEALGGLAKILDVGLKQSAADRQEKILGSLEDKLNVEAQAYGNSPPLVGEKSTPAEEVLNSTPSLKSGFTRIDGLRQGNGQGRITQGEFFGRTSSIVQQMIHDHPRFADAIRERAQKMLGTNPTSAMVEAQAKDEDAQIQQQRAFQADILKTAVTNGYVVPDGKGGYDMERTTASVLSYQRAEANVKNLNNVLDTQLKQAEIDKAKLGQPLTQEERDRIQQNALRGGPNGMDGLFQQRNDNMLHSFHMSKLLENVQPNTKEEAQAREQLLLGINNDRAQWLSYFDRTVNSLSADPKNMIDAKNAAEVREFYAKQYDTQIEWAKGPLSQFESNIRMVETGKNLHQLEFAKSAPMISMIEDAVKGPAGAAVLQSVLANSTTLRNLSEAEITTTIQNVAGVFSGTSQIALDPKNKSTVTAVVTGLQDMNNRATTLSDEEMSSWGNGAAALSSLGQQYDQHTPSQSQAAVDLVSSAAGARVFDRFAKAHPDHAQALGESIMKLNVHNLSVQAANIAPLVDKNQLSDTGKIAGQRHTITYAPVYNPTTGKMEVAITDEAGKSITDPRVLNSLPAAMVQRVNGMNRSFAALEHFQQYGDDHVKSITAAQYKEAAAQGAGIPLKQGTASNFPQPKPGEPVKAKDQPPVVKPQAANSTDGWSISVVE